MDKRRVKRDIIWKAARLLDNQLGDLDWLYDLYPDATEAEIRKALAIGKTVVAELERRGHE